MPEKTPADWDPRADGVLRDQRAAYDEMRARCPVAFSEFMQWSLFRHADVLRALHDTDTFSSAVSSHLSVPSGMDPPEHTEYRRVIDRHFSPEKMAEFEPMLREIIATLVRDAVAKGEVEFMDFLALPLAVRAQCAFLGWPTSLWDSLVRWTQQNYQATLTQDRPALSKLAREFESLIDQMLDERSQADATRKDDVMSELMREKVWGRSLSNEEIASILRTWTVGEIGSIASSIGILTHFLAENSTLQNQLRTEPKLISQAIEEVLRIHGPLVASRRVARKDVEIGGRKIGEGERVTLNWVSVNRDADVFEEPNEFQPDRDQSQNLLYGAGIHICPGAPLARLEMRVAVEELLSQSAHWKLAPNQEPENAVYPASGFSTLPLRISGILN